MLRRGKLRFERRPARSLSRVFWDAMSDVGVLSAWALYIIARVLTFVVVTTVAAVYVIPFLMITLAGNIGMDASTPVMDLVFIYGASGLFVVGMTLVAVVVALTSANRVFRKARDASLRWLARSGGSRDDRLA